MSIDDDEINHLADLARLNLDDAEKDELKDDLNEILGLAEKIQDVDTEGVEPTYHAYPLENVTRPDEPVKQETADKVLENAPDDSDGYFVVPKVIDNQ
ncbi:MAG: Asp-tRNA(Asn)/Glu-tRNA(Gln) amidotransferase subunit GatC [bacterium]